MRSLLPWRTDPPGRVKRLSVFTLCLKGTGAGVSHTAESCSTVSISVREIEKDETLLTRICVYAREYFPRRLTREHISSETFACLQQPNIFLFLNNKDRKTSSTSDISLRLWQRMEIKSSPFFRSF